jgi:DNA repair protein RadA/Sms
MFKSQNAERKTMKKTVTAALDYRRGGNPVTNLQGEQKPASDQSKTETESTMIVANNKVALALEGLPALEVSNRLFGGPRIAHVELDSDPRDQASEKDIVELNAEEVINRHKTRSISYLPVLGREKIIVKGWSHLIAGDPKVGKTELITRIITEWDKEKILYITEETVELWSFRLSHLPRDSKRQNHIVFGFALGATPETIRKRISEGNETVVIIDTIRNFFRFTDETDNSEVNRVLTPFIKAARDTKKTILFIHHTRKKGGQKGKAIAGGHAFLGSVDIAIELNRKGNTEQRELTGQGRLIEIEDFIYERSQDGSFVALGAAKDVSLDGVKKRITEVLSTEWKSTREVGFALDSPKPSPDQVLKALEVLAKEKRVERDPPFSQGKVQGATYKWRVKKTK